MSDRLLDPQKDLQRPMLAMESPPDEVETCTPFLHQLQVLQSENSSLPDAPREEEAWSDNSDRLLFEWSSDWQRRAREHEQAENSARKRYYMLQIPTALIPVILAPLLSSHTLAEDSPIVVFLLVVCAATSGLQSMLSLERKSEQHSQSAFRYLDLVTDVEEVLAKERRFRPRCSVTIQRFKMRMDAANHFSPPVPVQFSIDSEDSQSSSS
jgi:hypothetical protein